MSDRYNTENIVAKNARGIALHFTLEWILSHVEDTGSCWLWCGEHSYNGYGRVWQQKGQRRAAHKVVFEHLRQSVPPGLQLDHRCPNKHCVNPDHLEIVTPRENVLRGNNLASRNAKKTTCKRGHTLIQRGATRTRYCPTCNNMTKEQRATHV